MMIKLDIGVYKKTDMNDWNISWELAIDRRTWTLIFGFPLFYPFCLVS
jgi:hypothetical protein